MYNRYLLLGCLLCFGSYLSAQTFSNASSQLPASYNSGGCVGVTDMDGDGLDDIIVLHNSRFLRVMYQSENGFDLEQYGQVSGNNQWGMAIGDIASDGHRDVISGGSYDGVHFVQITQRGSASSSNLTNGSMFMQACNVVDIDNDGELDYFACHDDAVSRMWRNNGSGGLVPGNDLFDLTNYDTGNFPGTDHSGNYGSVWSDINGDGHLDLVIAKCRQFVSNPQDPRRINQAWINDGNGNFTEEAADRGLVLFEQSWTVDFADVNNDGHQDCLITNHSTTLKLLMNDGNGYFTDVTAEAGLLENGFFLQAKMADFDNDGFVDIIYAGGVHKYFRNNGDGTFSHIPNTFPYTDTMHSFGIGDLNNDGFLDVYASYGNGYVTPDSNNPDILWLNNGNNNNWVVFDLQGTESNIDAVGAKVSIFGDWGVQVREIRAGESYGIVNTFHAHFGIGQNSAIDQVVINWPSGIEMVIDNPDINTVHQIVEAQCVIEGIAITANGATEFCVGESVTLNAPDGFFYEWSTGEETQSITVTNSGTYSLIVRDSEGCAGFSNSITVTVIEPEVPVISADGETIFCQGGSVQLNATGNGTFTWSNGDQGQSIIVSTAGNYTVELSGQCASALTSEPIEVSVLAAPAPVAQNPYLVEQETPTMISVSGQNVSWFEAAFGGTAIAEGSSIEVNPASSFSLYAESVTQYGGETASGGASTFTQDGGQYHTNSSFWPVFDAHTDIIIESVRVFAGTSAERTIALIDNQGNTLESLTIFIPQGEQVIELMFSVPEGQQYGLRSVGSNPQLWRDGPPANLGYPYAIGDLATITSSSIEGVNAQAFYYFFYDWQVSTPATLCTSSRTEVVIEVNIPDVCLGDFDNDGVIGISDLLVFLSEYGCTSNCTADLDGDGIVGTSDLLIFLSLYGNFCNP